MKEFLKISFIKTITHPLTIKSLSLLILITSYRYFYLNTVHAETLEIPNTVFSWRPSEDTVLLFCVFGFFVIGFISATLDLPSPSSFK